jgi:iron complex transport system substrate-binding protein
LEARLDALKSKLSERPLAHVLFVVWEDPLITIGQNTFIADALRCAGAESAIVATQDWPQISLEEVMRVQPDYIILTPEHAERDNSNQLAELRARGIWRELNAVKTGRVALASNEIIRPSPGLVDAIETLARQLHPEAYAAPAAGAKTSSSNSASGSIHAVNQEECSSCGR